MAVEMAGLRIIQRNKKSRSIGAAITKSTVVVVVVFMKRALDIALVDGVDRDFFTRLVRGCSNTTGRTLLPSLADSSTRTKSIPMREDRAICVRTVLERSTIGNKSSLLLN